MSALERRLQVLLDEDRYARLEAESRATGRSMGAIVRGAIDLHFDADIEVELRREAGRRLLERTADPSGEPQVSTAELRDAYEQDLVDKLERLGL